jgi:cytochrome P450
MWLQFPPSHHPVRTLPPQKHHTHTKHHKHTQIKHTWNQHTHTIGAFAGCGTRNDTLDFAPFSFGPRNCLGMNLALLGAQVQYIAHIIQTHSKLHTIHAK